MKRILLFNPSHEMALAVNSVSYTPPRLVRQMETDLCHLPFLWAEPSDLVLTEMGLETQSGEVVSLPDDAVPVPWGWNRSVRHRFLQLGVKEHLMPTESQLALWRQFASRSWAVAYVTDFYEKLDTPFLTPCHMAFCHSSTQLEEWLALHPTAPYIVKSEFSSSGRGNRVLKPSRRVLMSDVAVDEFYDKSIDFAMEFVVSSSSVTYLGLSVFEATSEGKYGFNYVEPQKQLLARVLKFIPKDGAEIITRLAETHAQLLTQKLLGRYEGFVGIDMLVTTDGRIHPCIEINLRMNMGVLAMQLCKSGSFTWLEDRYGTSSGKFRPVLRDGKFSIVLS